MVDLPICRESLRSFLKILPAGEPRLVRREVDFGLVVRPKRSVFQALISLNKFQYTQVVEGNADSDLRPGWVGDQGFLVGRVGLEPTDFQADHTRGPGSACRFCVHARCTSWRSNR